MTTNAVASPSENLIEQARSIIAKALGDKAFVLGNDSPWKKTARRLLSGKDVTLGALTEVFAALSVIPYLATDQAIVHLGDVKVCTTPERIIDIALMLNGQTVNGCSFKPDSLRRMTALIKEQEATKAN